MRRDEPALNTITLYHEVKKSDKLVHFDTKFFLLFSCMFGSCGHKKGRLTRGLELVVAFLDLVSTFQSQKASSLNFSREFN